MVSNYANLSSSSLGVPFSPSISIIICTCDRARSLRQTLKAIGRQQFPSAWRVEVILVDNDSTDETATVAQNWIPTKVRVRYVHEPKKGLSNARNAGLEHSRGEFILFTDDDALPAQDWVEKMVSALATDGCNAVTGQFRPADYLMRPWLSTMHRWWLGDSSVAQPRNGVRELIGGNMGFRRSVLESVQSFDPELGAGSLGFAEDTLFGWQLSRAGFRIEYASKACVIHQMDVSRLLRINWLRAARKRGRTEAYLCYHWEHTDMPFPRLKWFLCFLKLNLRRMLQPPPPLQDEGCPLWEMDYVQQMAKSRQFCVERRRPRNYSFKGLSKRRL